VRRRWAVMAVAVAICAGCASPAAGEGATAAARHDSSSIWVNEGVPGLAVLKADGYFYILSVSCASGGKCAAGGYYEDSSGNDQAFVVSQQDGIWGTPEVLPGMAPLSADGGAQVESVSCPPAGSCAAGGYYQDASGRLEAFLVSEQNGNWGRAREVPGISALNGGGKSQVSSVSCASAGNCAAGGFFTGVSGEQRAFVVTEKDGTWAGAKQIAGTVPPGVAGPAQVSSVSCASARYCAAGGFYSGASGTQAFVVTERHGTWSSAVQVLGTGAGKSRALVSSVSCAPTGSCVAGGSYRDGSGQAQAFLVSERNGSWMRPEQVPRTAALNVDGNANVTSVSCPSAGRCAAAGTYQDRSGHVQAFVATQSDGKWSGAEQVPGTAALDAGGYAEAESVSCGSAGNCAAGGSYQDSSGHVQAFVVNESDNIWGRAKQVPGIAALNDGGYAWIYSVSCAPAARCSAAGFYLGAPRAVHPFLWSKP
jgi:hypothetical protein